MIFAIFWVAIMDALFDKTKEESEGSIGSLIALNCVDLCRGNSREGVFNS